MRTFVYDPEEAKQQCSPLDRNALNEVDMIHRRAWHVLRRPNVADTHLPKVLFPILKDESSHETRKDFIGFIVESWVDEQDNLVLRTVTGDAIRVLGGRPAPANDIIS